VLEKKCSLRDVQDVPKLCTAGREPVTDDAVMGDPVTDDPVTVDPVMDDPVTVDLVMDDPVTDGSTDITSQRAATQDSTSPVLDTRCMSESSDNAPPVDAAVSEAAASATSICPGWLSILMPGV